MRKLRNLGTWDVVERVEGESGNRIHGFERGHRSHVYRVVRITDGRTGKGKKESSMEAVQVEVCTVGRDSWKMLEPHGVSCFAGLNAPYSCILSFELASQKFEKLLMPEYHDRFKKPRISIAALKESLATLVYRPAAGNLGSEMHVWVMQRYGVVDSWTKQYTVVIPARIERVLGSTGNGEILIHRRVDYMLMCYDPENDIQFKDINVTGFPKQFDVVSYSESLVWPEEGNADNTLNS